MNSHALIDTARALVADDKGLLVMDESNSTCNKRFAKAGIPQTEEARRAYRELIVTTPGLGECINGAILHDETIRQRKKDGMPFVKILADAGVIPGIKVDLGAKDLVGHPGEKITEGLDGLRIRLQEYFQMGARFAKWLAVIAIGDGIPSRGCIEANAQALARYAALCQEGGLVSVVEPEVLMAGDHTLERNGGRGGRRHGEVSPSNRPRRRPGYCLPVGRPIRSTGLGAVERHEYQVQGATGATGLGAGFFVRSRDPATGLGDLGREEAHRLAAQQALYHRAWCNRAAPRRIQCRDGNNMSVTLSIPNTVSAA
jgi:Fructose-bisphosphate aldolase class-I